MMKKTRKKKHNTRLFTNQSSLLDDAAPPILDLSLIDFSLISFSLASKIET